MLLGVYVPTESQQRLWEAAKQCGMEDKRFAGEKKSSDDRVGTWHQSHNNPC